MDDKTGFGKIECIGLLNLAFGVGVEGGEQRGGD
jgi:hypothetical protein